MGKTTETKLNSPLAGPAGAAMATLARRLPRTQKSAADGSQKTPSNQAFSSAKKWPPEVLKKGIKILSFQYFTCSDFALGTWRLSWHK
jgi:hypothetical protein